MVGGPCPDSGLVLPIPIPQELAEARAGLQAQEKELCRAQGGQQELLQRLQETQEREAASASQAQALSSQLEEAQAARRDVSDPWRGWRRPRELGSRFWEHQVPLRSPLWPAEV